MKLCKEMENEANPKMAKNIHEEICLRLLFKGPELSKAKLKSICSLLLNNHLQGRLKKIKKSY